MRESAKAIAWAPLIVCSALLIGCGSVSGTKRDGGGGDDDDSGGAVCTAGAALRCDGDTLVSCNSDGTAEVQTACGLRCNATSLACENKVAPSNGYAAQLDLAATEPAVNIVSDMSLNYISGYNSGAGTLQIGSQTVKATEIAGANGAPAVIVASMGSLTIAAGVTVNLQGIADDGRQVAFMVAGDVTIAGTIDRGPTGAHLAGDTCNAAATNSINGDYPGSGGGGFGTLGADGGGILTVGFGGVGGTISGNETLVPLRPGCKGGNTAALGVGGTGGGAMQITSGTAITVSGTITAPGYGGVVNAGGGSGGAILLEAPTVMITGGVYANGGAGGCGDITDQGNKGTSSTTPTVGGPCPGKNYSAGNGGAGTTPPTNGASLANTAGQDSAPGGGGSVGRIRINTLSMTVSGAGAQSPPASLGTIAGR